MALLEIGPIVFGGTPGIIQYMRNHHLLATQQNCSRCNVPVRERPRPDVSDGISWWCPSCKTRKSIRNGSFFQKSHITLQKWLLLLHFWSREYPVTCVAEDVGIDSSTACDVYQWLREVCSTKLLGTPIVLGGQNTVVQIDESLFHHKPMVKKQCTSVTHALTNTHKNTFLQIINAVIIHSINVDGALNGKYGSLGWLMSLRSLHWAIWKLFNREMLPHCCL